MAKHVLITGFEPFGGGNVNPSELVARSLEGRPIAGRLIVTCILPVATRNVRERLERAMLEEQPDIVIALGQAGGRSAVALERVAVNVLDFDRPDNAGETRENEPIQRGGPDARLSGLPFDAIVGAWKEHDVPGYVSNSAGTYICNQVLYEVLGLAEAASPPIAAGFVHLPYLPAQAIAAGPDSSPSMSFDLMKRAMEILIETVVPWVEHRTSERSGGSRPAGSKMWIPRGVKEVER
ncbi:MAG TPA: pyroglutamyl-peptidase I [Candidatus Baltobacteraceae bacterium]